MTQRSHRLRVHAQLVQIKVRQTRDVFADAIDGRFVPEDAATMTRRDDLVHGVFVARINNGWFAILRRWVKSAFTLASLGSASVPAFCLAFARAASTARAYASACFDAMPTMSFSCRLAMSWPPPPP